MIASMKRVGIMRFLISVFVAALLAATQATAEPEAIVFSDLADLLAVAF